MKNQIFRDILRQELVNRCRQNPQYSLRSFARQLELDPSALSKLLNGKRPIGKRLTLQLAAKLGISSEDSAEFLKSGGSKELNYYQLALDQFAVISDWYHFAILELMAMDHFKPDHGWIANTLGLKKVEVDAAVDRLVRVGMIEIDEKGNWFDKSGGSSTNIGPDMMSTAHRTLQKELLLKAIEALQTVPLDYRSNTAATMAIDSSLLPEAKEKINKFRRSLAVFLSQGAKRDAIFNLSIALYPLGKFPAAPQLPRRK